MSRLIGTFVLALLAVIVLAPVNSASAATQLNTQPNYYWVVCANSKYLRKLPSREFPKLNPDCVAVTPLPNYNVPQADPGWGILIDVKPNPMGFTWWIDREGLVRCKLIVADGMIFPFEVTPSVCTVSTYDTDFRVYWLPYGPDTCKWGYVWRDAYPGDHVCVTPETRSQAAFDNSQANARRDFSGAHGRDGCLPGYVWRLAKGDDHVCVTPEIQFRVSGDNSLARDRFLFRP